MKTTKGYKRKIDNKMPYFGETNLTKKIIKVNKKKSKKSGRGELIDTIVHEEHHAKHPTMKEKNVQKATRALLPTLSTKQKQKYYKKYNC